MTIIVKAVTRLTLWFIIFYGIYIALNGHSAPGGGFAGGVIIGLSLIHSMLAFGREKVLRWLNEGLLLIIAGLGALAFLVSVIFGIGGMISPLCEAILVGFGIFGIFTALVMMSKTSEGKG